MEAQLVNSPSWLDVVAFDTEIAKDAKPEDVVFVDVGGGNGLQYAVLKKAFPHVKGRIILQGQRAALEKALEIDGIDTVAHDILTEQPLKTYYFHQILHDYDDDTCIQILQMHLPALYHSPESRLYINEKVLPDEKPDVNSSSTELNATPSVAMAALSDGQERSEAKWRWLFDQAGMEVMEIRKFTKQGDSVIIAKRRFQDQWR